MKPCESTALFRGSLASPKGSPTLLTAYKQVGRGHPVGILCSDPHVLGIHMKGPLPADGHKTSVDEKLVGCRRILLCICEGPVKPLREPECLEFAGPGRTFNGGAHSGACAVFQSIQAPHLQCLGVSGGPMSTIPTWCSQLIEHRLDCD